MTSVQLRSKSAQQRKLQKGRGQLQYKFDWILSQKQQYGQLKSHIKKGENQDKNMKLCINKIHPSIQKVESIEDMQLVGMKSAIHELQDLTTPRNIAENVLEYRRNHRHKEQIPQSFHFQEVKRVIQQDFHPRNKNERQYQTFQYYRGECEQLKCQLYLERTKNQDLMAIVKRLEHTNVQLQKEINLLVHKWQRQQSAQVKISQLQQNFKQQLIVNLELEEILLKQRLQIEKKQMPKQQKSEQGYKTIIKELKHRLTENKQNAQKETQKLKSIIEEKDKQIAQLKETINKLNEQLPQEKITSLNQIELPSNKGGCNFMERFVSFSKEMQVKLSKNQIVSTNPSLQDTALIDLQANRKHSESEYSKGCPSVEIPLLLVRDLQQKKASKTDRI